VARHRGWLAILAGACALRVVLLVARGDYIVYDEGYYLLLARSLREGHGFALNGLPHVALSPLQPLLVAALSAVGLPDLWASRLLAAACGALLVFPVAALARLAGGPRAALWAAVFAASSPALLSFVPFFPGESWNLYFGSEPLFLLLAFGAVVAAARAEEGRWRWWVAAGALAGLSYLARSEGAVLGAFLFAVLAIRIVARRGDARSWRRFGLGALAALVVAAPYLLYLHRTLGRWALSGRVQAASAEGQEGPSAVRSARAGGQVLDQFVWQGEPNAFLHSLYGLDPAGERMASQYWGVPREAAVGRPTPARATPPQAAAPPPPDSGHVSQAPAHRSALDVWRRGLAAVVPWWLGIVALAGLALSRDRARTLALVFPLATCALLPSLLTYVEPRSLLPLAPLAALYAAVGLARVVERAPARYGPLAAVGLPALVALALLLPVSRDLARAWGQTTPLQQVATARRAVGEYLGRHLPGDAIVMSWHPAVSIWAARSWRVLPLESFERIAAYARRERASVIVFSRFEPSPIRQPPRAFTIVLPGAGSASGGNIQLEPVDETPLLFVGRLAGAATAP
jgi:4-amino-4-deoxy-L-arabinose transferase-like glycosyltransferase